MKTTLLFVRHGQSIANENGIFAGHLDVPLSELGQKQAVELKDYLLSRYKNRCHIFERFVSRVCNGFTDGGGN